MADITKCLNLLCPNAEHCYRVQAKDSDWQSYSMFTYMISTIGVECENYWPTYLILSSKNRCED
jgi:hypothetical protein